MEMERESAREARRRKILERGSARLAFITGETRSLPPSEVQFPPPPPPSNEIALEENEGPRVTEVPIEREIAEIESTFASLGKQEEIEEAPESLPDTTSEIENEATFASLMDQERYKEAPESTPEITREIEPKARSSIKRPESRKSPASIFTAQLVSSAISSSENTRLLCALYIAILAILSCRTPEVDVGFLGSIIRFRPIYMVLFTDLSLLLGMVYSRAHEGLSEKNRTQEGGEWFDQIGKALEVVIIFQKISGAILSDLCICAVIIVCGVSFCSSL